MPKQLPQAKVRSKIRWGIFGIFALLCIAVFFDFPGVFNRGTDWINAKTHIGIPNIPAKPFQLGLDLQGGAHLVYQADVKNIPSTEHGEAVEGVRDVIERRVNALGVGESNVQTAKVGDDYRVIVELPGVTDVNQAIRLIGGTPILEFKEPNTTPPRELTPEEEKDIESANVEAKKKADEVTNRIKTEDFAAVAKETSDDESTKNNGGYMGFAKKSATPAVMYDWAKNAKEGDIMQKPIDTEDGFFLLKRGKEQEGELEVSASHILLCYLGTSNCVDTMTKVEALKKAEELKAKATPENFAELAKENSTEPGAATTGGDLGSFTRGTVVAPFAEATFAAKVNEIVGPIETQFGYHIIYKKGEEKAKEYELSGIFIKKKTPADVLPSADPWQNTALSGKQLERAEVVTDQQTGAVQVSLQFDNEGKELFGQITEKNVGKPVGIFLDGVLVTSPTVQQAIRDGRAVITGSFNIQEARLIAQRLNAGALPVPVELISQQTVGASLGLESLTKSLKAGIAGALLVMLFMILYYRFPGLLSVIALSLYVFLNLAIFKLIGVTLTLAGIAGFILSIGMAVDANILIFERMKEELIWGKSLKAAVEEGFLRAWTSIRDGNVSTLITCLLLMGFGSSFVQGFAITLAIGTFVSMFTAITISRMLLRFVVLWFPEFGGWAFLGGKKKV